MQQIGGTDVYPALASICTAAAHAGIITVRDGGVVALEFRGGRLGYVGSTRNGITTEDARQSDASFVVRPARVVEAGGTGAAAGSAALTYDKRMELAHEHLNANDGAYVCATDPVVARAPAIPAVDTAGIGAALAKSASAWRLSTEREIACRYNVGGFHPTMEYGEGFGSGRAWWVYRGDFDGDGKRDRAAVVTSRRDSTEARVAFLLATGRVVVAETGVGGDVLEVNSAADLGDLARPPALPRRRDVIAVSPGGDKPGLTILYIGTNGPPAAYDVEIE